jgi:hypothetical protein
MLYVNVWTDYGIYLLDEENAVIRKKQKVIVDAEVYFLLSR